MATLTAPAARVSSTFMTDARARLAARKAAILAPYTAVIDALRAEGAEVTHTVHCGHTLPGEWYSPDMVRIHVTINDRSGRVFVTAKLEGTSGRPADGNAWNHAGSDGYYIYCKAGDLVAVARSARVSRMAVEA